MNFENQTAIVTGAGRGIGHAIAARLASEGARVACVSRSEENAKRTADELNKGRANSAKHYAVDVADHAAVQKVGAQILEDFGKIDILVNNAGVTRDGLAMRMSIEDWDTVINTNLRGAFNFTQSILRAMIKQRSGRIINISSVIGLIGNAGQTNYAASKAGLIGLTKSLARELASRNVTVNAVAPGFITTGRGHVPRVCGGKLHHWSGGVCRWWNGDVRCSHVAVRRPNRPQGGGYKCCAKRRLA